MTKQNGFTLAEILITLIILGVVMTMTIPALISDTKRQENIAGYHRAVNTLNRAYAEYYNSIGVNYKKTCDGKEIPLLDTCMKAGADGYTLGTEVITKTGGTAQEPVAIGTAPLTSTTELIERVLKPHISHIKIADTGTVASCESGAKYLYASDGMTYCIKYESKGQGEYAENIYGTIWVDVNGEKKPNAISTSADLPGDTFPILIMKNRFIPGSTDSAKSQIAQDIYFGQKTNTSGLGEGGGGGGGRSDF